MIIIVILGWLSYLVLEPFIVAILTGLVLAYFFYPVFKRLNKKIKNKNLTAFIMSLVIIILLAVPTIFIIKETADEARLFYITAKAKLFNGNIFDVECPDPTTAVCQAILSTKKFISQPEVRSYIESGIAKFSEFVLDEASDLVLSLPRIFVSLFVVFFVCFYAILEGRNWVKKIKNLLPIKKKYQKEIFVKIDNISHGVIYGSVFIALIQGALGGIGFFIFGVNSPILFGILMSIFALIPLVGTGIIWAPAAFMMMLEGYIEGETSLLVRGIGLALYGLLIISTVDNILKPRLIGKSTGVHPVVVLLGVLGGISLLGFIGFVVGPIILSLFIAFLEIYEREKKVFMK